MMCAKPPLAPARPRGSAPLPAARGAVPPSVPSSRPSTVQVRQVNPCPPDRGRLRQSSRRRRSSARSPAGLPFPVSILVPTGPHSCETGGPGTRSRKPGRSSAVPLRTPAARNPGVYERDGVAVLDLPVSSRHLLRPSACNRPDASDRRRQGGSTGRSAMRPLGRSVAVSGVIRAQRPSSEEPPPPARRGRRRGNSVHAHKQDKSARP